MHTTSDVDSDFPDGDADVIVVGAGISGLAAAERVHRAQLRVRVLEARDRIGGRLWTASGATQRATGAFDLGGTWHWPGQYQVSQLAQELSLTVRTEHEHGIGLYATSPDQPPARVSLPTQGSLRIVGGSQPLALGLAGQLPERTVAFTTVVHAIELTDPGVLIHARNIHSGPVSMRAACVILAMPPRLIASVIKLPSDIDPRLSSLLRATPTWMGNAGKVVVGYSRPFWREAGLSGRAIVRYGHVREVHDASDDRAGVSALFGFVVPPPQEHLSEQARREAILAQFVSLFGKAAAAPDFVLAHDWSVDQFTATPADHYPTSWHMYGHPLFAQPHANNRLLFAGTETADDSPGHIEGALTAGRRAAEQALLMHSRLGS